VAVCFISRGYQTKCRRITTMTIQISLSLSYLYHWDIAPRPFSLFSPRDAMTGQVPPLASSPCPSPAMSPSAPSSSPTSSTPPDATTACVRGACTPALGTAQRQRHSRSPQHRLELGLKLGVMLGLYWEKEWC